MIQGEQDCWCQRLTPEALEAIIHSHCRPGNVREMINRIRQTVVSRIDGSKLEDLELTRGLTAEKCTPHKESEENARKKLIRISLAEYGYSISQTARSFGISHLHL